MGKKVNIELNMTPFIGLFALLVVNLLLTAVWNRVAMLSTDTSSTTSASEPMVNPQKKTVQLNVTIMKGRIEMSEDQKGKNIPFIEGKVDQMRFVTMLNQWKTKHPKKTDVILNTENSVTYNQLITVFDLLVGNGFPDVGVNTQ